MEIERRGGRLDELAARQHGLVSAGQLAALGFTPGRLRSAVVRGRLIPVRRSVYRLEGTFLTWEATVLAAVLAAPPGAVASHLTAARLWQLFDRDRLPSMARRTELSATCEVRLAGVTSHRRDVGPAERSVRFKVPVTSVGRTLLDVGTVVDARQLGALTDEALRRGVLRLDQLRRVAEVRSGGSGALRRGAPAVQEALAERRNGYDAGANAWERRMDTLWELWGLPAAERQYRIVTAGGVYIPDRAILAERVAIDWNGFDYHGRRHHFDYDSDRRADLTSAGWYPLDFTSRSSPERICSAVLAVVRERRRSAR